MPPENSKNIDDIIGVVHEQANALHSTLEVQKNLLKYIEADSALANPVSENLDRTIVVAVDNFKQAFERLVDDVGDSTRSRGIDEKKWSRVIEIRQDLKEYNQYHSNLSKNQLRKIAFDAQNSVKSCASGDNKPKFNNQIVKNFYRSARGVQGIVCIYEMRRMIERVGNINNQLRSIIEMQETKTSDRIQTLRINDVVRKVVDNNRAITSIRTIDIRTKLSRSDLIVSVDLKKLEQSLENLIDNAIKYTGELESDSTYENTWITVFTEQREDSAVVAVESWGIPVSEVELEQGLLFKAGFRGRYARASGIEGTGMGLADVKKFAEENEGDVEFKTNPISRNDPFLRRIKSEKTTVSLILPLRLFGHENEA